jgi:hypothetical protein
MGVENSLITTSQDQEKAKGGVSLTIPKGVVHLGLSGYRPRNQHPTLGLRGRKQTNGRDTLSHVLRDQVRKLGKTKSGARRRKVRAHKNGMAGTKWEKEEEEEEIDEEVGEDELSEEKKLSEEEASEGERRRESDTGMGKKERERARDAEEESERDSDSSPVQAASKVGARKHKRRTGTSSLVEFDLTRSGGGEEGGSEEDKGGVRLKRQK